MATIGEIVGLDLGAVFFAENGIGVLSATYRDASGGNLRELRGVFDNSYQEVTTGFVEVASTSPMFRVASSNFPNSFVVTVGDTLVIQTSPTVNTTYKVQSVEPDGHGVSILMLEAQ